MQRVRISLATRALSMDLKNSIDTAMRWGVQGIQVDLRSEIIPVQFGESARRQLLHSLQERGLQIASGHFPLRNPLTASERLGERLNAIREAINFASKLKIRTLTLRAGRVPSPDEREEFNTLVSVLSELAALGNQLGVTLCLIPCGESIEETRNLISAIRTGHVAVDADLAAWVMNRQKIVTQLRELHDLIGHVEIRDAIRDVDGRGREVPVGRGEVDWDEVAALLGEMEYAGWLNVDRVEGSDRAGDLMRAVQFMKNLLPVG